jgi:hypothetical protein
VQFDFLPPLLQKQFEVDVYRHRPAAMGRFLPVATVSHGAFLSKANTSCIQMPTDYPPSVTTDYPTATEGVYLLLQLNLIQRLIHRQFPQHHHLRNPQQRLAV